jgi:hypothetical protein
VLTESCIIAGESVVSREGRPRAETGRWQDRQARRWRHGRAWLRSAEANRLLQVLAILSRVAREEQVDAEGL